MADDVSYLVGERDKHYITYHKTSVNWVGATTPLLLQPSASTTYLVSRLGFAAYNATDDFAQDIKLDFYDGKNWETRYLASNYAGLSVVSDRIDDYKIGAKAMLVFLWHFRNGLLIHGTLGEQLKIYPSANITNCANFHGGVRYFEFV